MRFKVFAVRIQGHVDGYLKRWVKCHGIANAEEVSEEEAKADQKTVLETKRGEKIHSQGRHDNDNASRRIQFMLHLHDCISLSLRSISRLCFSFCFFYLNVLSIFNGFRRHNELLEKGHLKY